MLGFRLKQETEEKLVEEVYSINEKNNRPRCCGIRSVGCYLVDCAIKSILIGYDVYHQHYHIFDYSFDYYVHKRGFGVFHIPLVAIDNHTV